MRVDTPAAGRAAERGDRRAGDIRRALRLEWFSISYNVAEAVVGLAAGLAAGSIALIGFALDSVVESASAGVLLWRLKAEATGRRTAEDAERIAVRLVGGAFSALALYVGVHSVADLAARHRPDESVPGIVLAAASVVIMPVLARAKRRAARTLDSRSLRADSTQTQLCTFLSAFLLVGLVANAGLGWWWADPAAGLVIAGIAAREGRELWTTKDFCCP